MKYIILYAARFPVRLVTNVCGDVFDLVSKENATRFGSYAQAKKQADEHGIAPGHVHIVPEDEYQEGFVNLVCPICKKVHAPFCGTATLSVEVIGYREEHGYSQMTFAVRRDFPSPLTINRN